MSATIFDANFRFSGVALNKLMGPQKFDWDRFVRAAEIFLDYPSVPAALRELYYSGDDAIVLHSFLIAVRWCRSGWATFEITKQLSTQLKLTDCSAVPLADVRFPHTGIKLIGATKDPLYLCRLLSEESTNTSKQPMWFAMHEEIAATQYVMMPEENARTCGDFCRSELETLRRELKEGSVPPNSYSLRAFLCNLFLYIAQQRRLPAIESTVVPRHKKALNRRHYIVGKGVTLPQAFREVIERKGPQNLWKLKTKHIVRGHWRKQVCGPGKQDRKLIWVEPFWRGPKDGPVTQRKYDVA